MDSLPSSQKGAPLFERMAASPRDSAVLCLILGPPRECRELPFAVFGRLRRLCQNHAPTVAGAPFLTFAPSKNRSEKRCRTAAAAQTDKNRSHRHRVRPSPTHPVATTCFLYISKRHPSESVQLRGPICIFRLPFGGAADEVAAPPLLGI